MGSTCSTYLANVYEEEPAEESKKLRYEELLKVSSDRTKNFEDQEKNPKLEVSQMNVLRSLSSPSLYEYLQNKTAKRKSIQVGDSYKREGIILFIDISGFTKLTENLVREEGNQGAEKLTTIINDYFGHLIKVVDDFGGYIEKFAGDAIITTFFDAVDLKKAFCRAAQCSKKLVEKYGNYSVGGQELSIHMAISGGDCEYIQLGGNQGKYKQILIGKPLWDLGTAVDAAENEQIVVTHGLGHFLEESQKKAIVNDKGDILLNVEALKPMEPIPNPEYPLEEITPQLCSYLEDHIYKNLVEKTAILPEIKNIAILFIHIPFELIQQDSVVNYVSIFQTIQRIAHRFEGGISNILADEKGMHVLLSFGYPYQFEDVHYRAIKAALELQKQSVEGLYIGVTYGLAYCGAVGNHARQDITTMGDKVNLAARLAIEAKKNKWAIVVERDTFIEAIGNAFTYTEADPIQVKGKSNPIPIFLPQALNSHIMETMEIKQLFSRDEEKEAIEQWDKKTMWLTAEAGMGKTSFLKQAFHGTLVSIDATDILAPYSSWRMCFEKLSIPQEDVIEYLQKTKLAPFVPLLNPILQSNVEETSKSRKLSASKMTQHLYSLFELIDNHFFKKEPLLIGFDNAQWMDAQSFDLLKMLINKPLNHMKVLVSSREKPTIESDKLQLLKLRPLEEDAIKQLILQMLPNVEYIDSAVLSFFVDKTEGNPQVTMELLELLQNHSIQVFNVLKNTLHFTDPFKTMADAFHPPSKRSEFLLGKIDRQQPSAKLLLKVISIFQSSSIYKEDLQAFCKNIGYAHLFDDAINHLIKHHFIIDNEKTFNVVNSEILKVLYSILPQQLKGNYHMLLAKQFAAQIDNASTSEKLVELCCQQYILMVENLLFKLDEKDEAFLKQMVLLFRQYVKTCKRKMAYHAIIQATNAVFDTLKFLNQDNDDESRLWWHTYTANVLIPLNAPTYSSNIVRHLQLALFLIKDDHETEFKFQWSLWFQAFAFNQGDHLELAKKLWAIAKKHEENHTLKLQAHRSMALSLYREGQFETINQHVDDGIAIYNENPTAYQESTEFGGSDPGVSLLAIASRINWLFGKYPQSHNYAKDALLSHEQVSDLYSKLLYFSYTCYNLTIAKKVDELAEMIALAKPYYEGDQMDAYRNYEYELSAYSDYVQAQSSKDPQPHLDSLRANIDALCTLYDFVPHILWFCYMDIKVSLLADSPNPEELEELIQKLTSLTSSSEVALSSEFHRLTAEVAAKLPLVKKNSFISSKHMAKIEESLFQAIEIAHHEKNFSFMLRSALTLIRLWEQANVFKKKNNVAYRILKNINQHILDHHLDDDIANSVDTTDGTIVMKELQDIEKFSDYFEKVSSRYVEKDQFSKDINKKYTNFRRFNPILFKLCERIAKKQNETVVPFALKSGHRIPHFTVHPYKEEPMDVYELLKGGPLVINFFRGSWCPFCTAEMCNLDKEWSMIRGHGANIVSISNHKDAPSKFIQRKVKMTIAYDENLEIAKMFRIVCDMEIYLPNFPKFCAYPATYIVNQEGFITSHFVDARFWIRQHPSEILTQLQTLQNISLTSKKEKDSTNYPIM